MRKIATIALATAACVVLAANGWAESTVRDECVFLCQAAANFVKDNGVDAGIAEIGRKDGRFVSKNTYVFLMDLDGNRLAHPYATPKDPKIMKLIDMKDTTGKLFVQDYVKIVRTRGQGWTEYMYPTPEELKKPIPFKDKVSSKKLSYVYRIPGEDLFVVAGYFE